MKERKKGERGRSTLKKRREKKKKEVEANIYTDNHNGARNKQEPEFIGTSRLPLAQQLSPAAESMSSDVKTNIANSVLHGEF